MHDGNEIRLTQAEAERLLRGLQRVALDSRQLMDGAGPESPSTLGHGIHSIARGWAFTIRRLLEQELEDSMLSGTEGGKHGADAEHVIEYPPEEPLIWQDEGRVGSRPCVYGSRLPIEVPLEALGEGASLDEIEESWPSATPDVVRRLLGLSIALITGMTRRGDHERLEEELSVKLLALMCREVDETVPIEQVTPRLRQILRQGEDLAATWCGYETWDDLAEAMRVSEQAIEARVAQLRDEVEEGLEQARRGELLDGREVRKQRLEKSRNSRPRSAEGVEGEGPPPEGSLEAAVAWAQRMGQDVEHARARWLAVEAKRRGDGGGTRPTE